MDFELWSLSCHLPESIKKSRSKGMLSGIPKETNPVELLKKVVACFAYTRNPNRVDF